MGNSDRIREFLLNGVREGVYPGAVLLVAREGEAVFFEEAGNRMILPQAEPMRKDTIFDLASLTKPLATTLAVMKLVDEGKIRLDQPIQDLITGEVPNDKKGLTPRLLLSHSAGFIDWQGFYLELEQFEPKERKSILRNRLLEMPLAYPPGKGTIYSDLGFMLLEWIVQHSAGEGMHEFLDEQFYIPLSLRRTFLGCADNLRTFASDEFAATEDCPWRKRIIQGDVHDENAYVLGGYSGHAGLFGTAEEVYGLVALLRSHFLGERSDFLSPDTVRAFFIRQKLVAGSTWALGWDMPSPENSSSGRYFSENSVGHLGFTGTSIWMDLEQDRIAILLTNRVHPTRNNEKIKAFRPQIHDLIVQEL
jgi:CubicO group peptidase (beta-lactamase class C family)